MDIDGLKSKEQLDQIQQYFEDKYLTEKENRRALYEKLKSEFEPHAVQGLVTARCRDDDDDTFAVGTEFGEPVRIASPGCIKVVTHPKEG